MGFDRGRRADNLSGGDRQPEIPFPTTQPIQSDDHAGSTHWRHRADAALTTNGEVIIWNS